MSSPSEDSEEVHYADLNGNERDVLRAVVEIQSLGSSTRLTDIYRLVDAKRGRIRRDSTYRVLDRLVEYGCLRKVEDDDVEYRITEAGFEIVDALSNEYHDIKELYDLIDRDGNDTPDCGRNRGARTDGGIQRGGQQSKDIMLKARARGAAPEIRDELLRAADHETTINSIVGSVDVPRTTVEKAIDVRAEWFERVVTTADSPSKQDAAGVRLTEAGVEATADSDQQDRIGGERR